VCDVIRETVDSSVDMFVFVFQSREGIDLLERTQEISDRIKNKWISPDVSHTNPIIALNFHTCCKIIDVVMKCNLFMHLFSPDELHH